MKKVFLEPNDITQLHYDEALNDNILIDLLASRAFSMLKNDEPYIFIIKYIVQSSQLHDIPHDFISNKFFKLIEN